MRAKINHGQRGTKIETLLKEYEFEEPQEYFGYMIDSYVFGHEDQVIELFNRMNESMQKSFLLNACAFVPVYGEKVHDLIIKSL